MSGRKILDPTTYVFNGVCRSQIRFIIPEILFRVGFDNLKSEKKTRQAMNEWRNIEAHSYNNYCSAKAIRVTYSECVFVALGNQHAMRVRYIVICSLSGSTIFFSTLLNQRQNFRKKKLLDIKYVFWFSLQLFAETLLIIKRNERDIIKKYISVHIKYHFSCQILMKPEFSRQILEKYSIINLKSRPVEPSYSMQIDGRTDRQT